MDNFKRKIRSRAALLIILLLSLLANYLILFLNQENMLKPSNNIISFHGGVLSSFSLLLGLNIFRYLKAIKDDKKLRELYIKENDERTIMIMQKTGAIGINICIIGLGLTTIIAGYFNELIFFTLLGATLFVALVKGLFKIYYHRNL